MQNPTPHIIPHVESHQLPSIPQPDAIRDKLSTHVKKRILSNPSPVQQSTGSSQDTSKCSKIKRSKKDPDSESGTTKDEEKTKTSDKHSHKPDILTLILNEKKASLMRDPEVIAFLKKFNQELQRARTNN